MSFILRAFWLVTFCVLLTSLSFSQTPVPGYQGKRLKLSLNMGIVPLIGLAPYSERDKIERGSGFYSNSKLFNRNLQYRLFADWAINRKRAIGMQYAFQKFAVSAGISKPDDQESQYEQAFEDYTEDFGGEIYQDVRGHLITFNYSFYKQIAPTGMCLTIAAGPYIYTVANTTGSKKVTGAKPYVMLSYTRDRLLFGKLFFSAGAEVGYVFGTYELDAGSARAPSDASGNYSLSTRELENHVLVGARKMNFIKLKIGLSYVL